MIYINFEKYQVQTKSFHFKVRMKQNMGLVEDHYDSQELFVPSYEFSDDFINQILYEIGEAQIEQSDYQQNQILWSQNHPKNSKKLPDNLQSTPTDHSTNIQKSIPLCRSLSQLLDLSTKSKDFEQQIYEESNSKTEINPSENQQAVILPEKFKKKPIKKLSKEFSFQTPKQRTSQRLQDPNYKPRKNLSSSKRKGKHNQSRTQKFIYFMTRYHYSKNFYQYYKKKIIQKVGNLCNYSNLTPTEKIMIVEGIIEELGSYKMAVHYSVEKSKFLNSFSVNQQRLIRQLFWQVIQTTYKIRFELQKKYIQNGLNTEKPKSQKFFDQKGEKAFERLFEQIMAQYPFSQVLINCDFVSRFQNALNKKQSL